MAENIENNKVEEVTVEETTAVATTEPKTETVETSDKKQKIKTGLKIFGAVAAGVVAFLAGKAAGERKAAKNSEIIDTEPISETNEEEALE